MNYRKAYLISGLLVCISNITIAMTESNDKKGMVAVLIGLGSAIVFLQLQILLRG